MLSLRSPVILAALPAGLMLGAAAWLVFGGSKPVLGPVQDVETQLRSLNTRPAAVRTSAADAATQATAAPLFGTLALNVSVPDMAVKVLGIARTPSGSSALLSVNNGPAEWLIVGMTKDGVTLQEVTASKVVLETPGGSRDIALGETSTPSPAAPVPSAPAGRAPSLAGGQR